MMASGGERLEDVENLRVDQGKIVRSGRRFYCKIINVTREAFERFKRCQEAINNEASRHGPVRNQPKTTLGLEICVKKVFLAVLIRSSGLDSLDIKY